jgi:signal transduction histidine kinase
LLYALYRYRVRQILKVERIRQKLSSDLHDDIGSTLNSVNLFTKMAMMKENKDEYLPRIKEGVQSAITGVRDIIWILDKEPETIESIFGRISSFSLPLAKAAGCAINTHIHEALAQYTLAAEEKRNVYLVIKEAINNCIKYAGCSNIALSADKQAGQLVITISDDGKGFDSSGEVKVSEGGGGNGLKNMQLRCAEIKWKLLIQSSPGQGSSICLTGKIKD